MILSASITNIFLLKKILSIILEVEITFKEPA